MANAYKVIDEKAWERNMHCMIFRNSVEPAFCVTYNATPLFDWGKYYEKDGRVIMPVSVQAYHSFVDGIHIGKFVDKLQKYLNEL